MLESQDSGCNISLVEMGANFIQGEKDFVLNYNKKR